MAYLKVHTAQNVLLEYPVGNIGQRIAAALVDLIVAGLYIWLAEYAFRILSGTSFFEGDGGILEFFLIFLPAILYLPVAEYFWNGRTVGKYLFKLKVVKNDGTAASLGDYILRWLIRTIDVKLGFLFIFFIPRSPDTSIEEVFLIWTIIFLIIPFPLVGIISMALSKTCQRVGDRVANTVVINSKKPVSLDSTILQATEKNYVPVYPNVLTLSDNDIYIIKNVLDNLKRTGDHKPVWEIGEKAKQILDIKDDVKPYVLLKTILKDYNYLARERDLKDLN